MTPEDKRLYLNKRKTVTFQENIKVNEIAQKSKMVKEHNQSTIVICNIIVIVMYIQLRNIIVMYIHFLYIKEVAFSFLFS